jgi:hypothetical protein
MQEAPAAHEAFAGVLAIDDVVDRGQIGLAVALAALGRGVLPRWFCAFCTRSGVAGCDDRKSCARGSSEVLPAFIAALRSIAVRKRAAP